MEPKRFAQKLFVIGSSLALFGAFAAATSSDIAGATTRPTHIAPTPAKLSPPKIKMNPDSHRRGGTNSVPQPSSLPQLGHYAPLGTAPAALARSQTVFHVTTTTDEGLKTATATSCVDASTNCSLRAAFEAADNLGTLVTIDVPAGTYTVKTTSLIADDPGGIVLNGSGETATVFTVTIANTSAITEHANTTGVGGTLWISTLSIRGANGTEGGGALAMKSNTVSAVLTHVTFSTDDAALGGAIYQYTTYGGGHLWISDSRFATDESTSDGGALYAYWGDDTLTDDVFTNNWGKGNYGGAIYWAYGQMTISGTTISTNYAGKTTTYSTRGYGGGLYNYCAIIHLDTSTIDHDTALYNGVGGGYATYEGQLTSTNSTFDYDTVGNADGYGGGIAIYESGQVALHHVVMQHDASGGYSWDYTGSAVSVYDYELASSLTIDTHSTLSTNTTSAVFVYSYYGGANVQITDTTFAHNDAPQEYSGAAVTSGTDYGQGSISLLRDTFIDNSASTPFASGSVFLYGYYGGTTLNVTSSTFTGNSGTGYEDSGAIVDYSYEYSGVSTNIDNSTFTNNTAPDGGDGGAIDLYGYDDYSPLSTSINNSVFSTNSAGSTTTGKEGYGGAIVAYYFDALTVTNSSFVQNRAIAGSGAAGGAIYDDSYESAHYVKDIFETNSATGKTSRGGALVDFDDGGITITSTTISHNSAVYGGGIDSASDAYETLLRNSTISHNVAGGTSFTDSGYGGGIYVTYGKIVATNSTIADNVANSFTGNAGYGGGVYAAGHGSLALNFATVSGNKATTGSFFAGVTDGLLTLHASVLGMNATGAGENCIFDTSPIGTSVGDNVLSSTTCIAAPTRGDVVGVNPLLGTLSTNGGPAQSEPLLPTSPAIGIVSATCKKKDERGKVRPAHNCDAGAYQHSGYYEVASDGGVFAFGAPADGSMGATPLNQPIVAMSVDHTSDGYYMVAKDGGVFAFTAPFAGSLPQLTVHVSDIVGIAAAPGGGYWMVGSDGGVFAFTAPYFGSVPALGIHVNNIKAIVATPNGDGYWLIANDGAVYAFGTAPFKGSLPGIGVTVSDIVGAAATPSGNGYLMVGADGGVFTFGDATFHGSMGGRSMNAPVVAIAPTTNAGYWLIGADGGIFAFGSAQYEGSMGGHHLNQPIVGGTTY
jgi:hypothetical protein